MRPKRRIVAVRDGVKKEFDSVYAAAKELETSTQNVALALSRFGFCSGWKMYDSPETIREKIAELQKRLDELEDME